MSNETTKKRAVVIGAGFSGLSSAAHLAKRGFSVTVLEKLDQAGGRARMFQEQGFTFDMGPSWYWMPDVFERFFEEFGSSVAEHYELRRLSPSYRVFFEDEHVMDLPSTMPELLNMFESLERGSSGKLQTFLHEAEYKYTVGMRDLVYKPGRSIREFADRRVVGGLFRLQMLTSMHTHVTKLFRDSRLIRLLEFPVLFLGARPKSIPALYSMMNYADMVLGTWYPMGGMHRIVEAMVKVVQQQGVTLLLGEEVTGFTTSRHRVSTVKTARGEFEADVVVASADYHHVDQELLETPDRSYTADYWNKRTMAPSSLIYYIGLNKRLDGVLHHNLFFDRSFDAHAVELYDRPMYPTDPLFYLCVPSKTDDSVAPPGHENLFVLIPTAPGIVDTPEIRERYFDMVIERIEQRCGCALRDSIVFRRDYAHNDFVRDYHSYKGNAYGLANTLRQTAILKPAIQSKKLRNLYFCGQLTVPGPGVPPSLISGKVVADCITSDGF